MDTPKVSILIPLYNRIRYAEECIKSALNQTFQDTEVVIRDDCSTDGVFDFVREKFSEQISSGKIKLFRNEKNLGFTMRPASTFTFSTMTICFCRMRRNIFMKWRKNFKPTLYTVQISSFKTRTSPLRKAPR